MNEITQSEILNKNIEETRKGRINNRAIVAVYIRGLAFKCQSASRREQVLNQLKKLDERGNESYIFNCVFVAALVGWGIWELVQWLIS